jgi:hypothetical protein
LPFNENSVSTIHLPPGLSFPFYCYMYHKFKLWQPFSSLGRSGPFSKAKPILDKKAVYCYPYLALLSLEC